MAAYIIGMQKIVSLASQEKRAVEQGFLEFFEGDGLLGSYEESAKISAVPGAVCLLTFGVLRRIDVPSFLFTFVFESSRSLAEELPCPNFVPSTTT